MINRIVVLGLFFLSSNQCILAQLNPPFPTICPNLQMLNCPNGTGFDRVTPTLECSCVECPPDFCSPEGSIGPCIPCTMTESLLLHPDDTYFMTCPNIQMLNCPNGTGFDRVPPTIECSCVECPLDFCSPEGSIGPCIPCTITESLL